MQPQQRTPEWYKARLGRTTASRADHMVAKIQKGEAAVRRNYRADLVIERLTGQPSEYYQSKEMLWGIEYEPVAAFYFVAQTKLLVEECPFIPHKTLKAGASPDRFIGKGGTLEIKCPKSATHILTLRRVEENKNVLKTPLQFARDVVPAQYFAQVQFQLWISGRKWAKFASFDPRLPENARLVVVDVPRDEPYIKWLDRQTRAFLKEVDAEVKFVKGYGK